ncbi:MAG TPA: heavy metal translocating P-type ATPase [Burkholderiales bacterium]|nr:heavy metal translocating P-type ATPase [Burkholderiales bacterium]
MTDSARHLGHRAHRHSPGNQTHAGHDHEAMIADFRRRFWVSVVLTLPVLWLSPMIRHAIGLDAAAFPGSGYWSLGLSSVVYFYGGWPFLTGLFSELAKRQPGMMTLIAVAISAAYFYSAAVVLGLGGTQFFWELATLIDIMLVGHWIEMRSVMGASRALKSLAELLPAVAHRLRDDGSIEDVPVSGIQAGDRVLVKPGEKIPTDGVIVEGRSSLNESMLTGESKPVTRGKGEDVIGGAINGEGSLTLEIRKIGAETYLSQVIKLVEAAQASRSRSQDIANRAAFWLTLIALGVGTLTLVVWIALGAGLPFAMERMVTVMVIACPHALGLAVPLVVAVSTSLAANSGLLIRDRAAFERARNLNAVLFDKTGTLTEGRFGVTDVVAFTESTEREVIEIAAALESHSEHPIALGIVTHAREKQINAGNVTDFRNLTGQGAVAKMNGEEIAVVGPGYLREHGLSVDQQKTDELSSQAKTVVFVLRANRPLGAIALADVVRPESREAVAQLKAMGIQCMMITGDNGEVARAVSAELGLDDFFAQVLPHEKAAKVKEVQSRGLSVAMVGDGVNDAPALTQSDLGIAIGAGTNVAIESADIVLVRSNPLDIPAILSLSRATYSKMVQNLIWATAYNAVAIPLAAGVAVGAGLIMSPAMGAVLMSASTVIVAINARLLGRGRGGKASAQPAV